MIKSADRLGDVKEYYFSKKLRAIGAMIQQGKPIINMAIGSPDLPPSPKVVSAIKSAVDFPNAHQYQSYLGIPELRRSMGKFYQEHYGVSLDENSEILPLMGSKEGILHISMAFLNKGDGVLIPNPGYPTYASVAKLVEAVPQYYKLNEIGNWLPNLQELEKQDLSKVKLMWVNYPHMPTGATASINDFEQLIAFAKKHQILIVNDNPYSFILNNNPLSILAVKGAKEIALELNSLSKTFNMAGWRVGLVVGNSDAIKKILQVKTNMDSGMFYGIQKGAIEALKLPKSWMEGLNETYAKRRALVWKIFDELNCVYQKTNGGLFVWAEIPNGYSAEEFSDALLDEYDVFLAPGTVFGSQGEGYIRAALCISEKNLTRVLQRVTKNKK